ncbi:hypothetical protein [Candidatus Methylacidithermus pantelleriae]|uniref:hypothetical protein n=1 Tax=Candidatus Methylacidithermus pantelleriae TaxID=2744239 RepID=UPI00157DC256|nr:hypothetical protein [Candidatus Methylacidithermus pantelleriae]
MSSGRRTKPPRTRPAKPRYLRTGAYRLAVTGGMGEPPPTPGSFKGVRFAYGLQAILRSPFRQPEGDRTNQGRETRPEAGAIYGKLLVRARSEAVAGVGERRGADRFPWSEGALPERLALR